jgi:hypothetical protein
MVNIVAQKTMHANDSDPQHIIDFVSCSSILHHIISGNPPDPVAQDTPTNMGCEGRFCPRQSFSSTYCIKRSVHAVCMLLLSTPVDPSLGQTTISAHFFSKIFEEKLFLLTISKHIYSTFFQNMFLAHGTVKNPKTATLGWN